MSGGRISKKPTTVQTGGKSSDRRLAGSRQAASYLHTSINNPTNNTTKVISAPLPPTNTSTGKTVKRQVGTQSWEDSSLLDWDPKHFRLFVGNLGQDVTEQLLHDTFKKYPTMSMVRVPQDKKTGKNKGYGFVAFKDSNDYFQAFKDMNGKYIGQHPVQLKRAETNVKQSKTTGKPHGKPKRY
ncbi:hypothetical protein DFJ63DRAFT_286071 [Scheffersomyces coipomensis]|uniref:uncharacterized protein n=1 Tax=Scheffersomyces coipomensis TaxID=1788519 RepID=UPI00315D561B